jgi:tetratricopeptide (TPR) repeat protein/tRNA A-37 threonylcarbamoyl transferase component Bud32
MSSADRTATPLEATQLDRRASTALAERYRIDHVLGRGGMATVYAADDLKHGRRVAIKIVDPAVSVALGPERFLREIRVSASLQHPNILPLFDSGEAGDLLYYVMPLVEGVSLREQLKQQGQLRLDEAIRTTEQVAAALDYAHSHGVVHRDIKPENILLDGDRAVVADFGIAKSLDAASESLTATGVAVGTPTYMSPEQSSGERIIDGRSDVYSLACVLFELLAGEPPFTGASAAAVIAKRFAGPPPSVRVVRDGVPLAVDRAISRSLARAPADRFATAGEFTRALRSDGTRGFARPKLFRGAVVAVVAAVAIAAAAVGAGVWTIRNPSRTATLDSVAVSLVARGNVLADKRTAEGLQRAVPLYRQAIAQDSVYTDAWAGLARALQFAYNWRFQIPGLAPDSVIPLMVRAADRAVELDSGSVLALLAKSQVLRVVDPMNLVPRFEIVRRALKLDSTSVDAWYQLGNLWQDSLELHRAIDAYRRAVTIRPTHANSLAFIAFAYCWLRQPDSALVWADRAVKVDPENVLGRQAVAFAYRGRGEWDATRPAYDAVVVLGNGPEQVFGFAGLAELAWRRHDRRAAESILRQATAHADTLNPTIHDAAYLAWGYAQTGQPERALRLLEHFAPRSDKHFQLHLKREPTLDALRALPRFQALLVGPGQ